MNISQQQLLLYYSTTFKSTCRNYKAPTHRICSCCATQLRSRRFRSKGKLLSSPIIRVCYLVLLRVYFACFDDYHISLSIIHTNLFCFLSLLPTVTPCRTSPRVSVAASSSWKIVVTVIVATMLQKIKFYLGLGIRKPTVTNAETWMNSVG